jgi:hypothetical protein
MLPSADDDKDGYPCIKGTEAQSANLQVVTFQLQSIPYLQQDPTIDGQCATASVYFASSMLASQYDLPRFPYVRFPPRRRRKGPGTSGLSADEIKRSLRRLGTRAQILRPSNPKKPSAYLRELLYIQAESSLPSILCMHQEKSGTGHAVTVIGHRQSTVPIAMKLIGGCSYFNIIKKLSRWTEEQKKIFERHYTVGQTVDRYYIHDESTGPFNQIRFGESYYPMQVPLSLIGNKPDTDITFELAEVIGCRPFLVATDPMVVMHDAILRCSKMFFPPHRSACALWRVLLTKSTWYKQSFHDPRRILRPEMVREIVSTHIPRYIWLCEFSFCFKRDLPAYIASGMNRRTAGEFIYDSATRETAAPIPLIQRHNKSLLSH